MASDLTFSPDGNHFWDGQAWQPAVSPDGRWRWNGTQWQPVAARAWSTGAAAAREPEAASTPASASWQLAVPQARSLTRPGMPAASQAGALPGLDGRPRRSNRTIGYRQEATRWTNPLLLGCAAYFIAMGIYQIKVEPLIQGPLMHDAGYAASHSELQAGYTSSGAVGLALLYGGLCVLFGLLSFTRSSLVYTALTVLAGAAIVQVIALFSAGASPVELVPRSLLWSTVALDLGGGLVFLLMLFARRAHGPWGLRRIRVYAEPAR